MAARNAPKRITKREFVRRIRRGTLATDQAIGKLVNELQSYERKYGTEVFYALIPGTPAEDHPDFLEWAICYRSYFCTLQAKFPFKELARYVV